MRIVLIAYYYPPINSSGAKRFEALSKFLAALGHSVTVITTQKTLADGVFSEDTPSGVRLFELNKFGLMAPSVPEGKPYEPMFSGNPSGLRRLKDLVYRWFGQVPDPRLPFAFSFLSPWFPKEASNALAEAHVVIGTSPPWPMLLAAILIKFRYGVPCVLDYRDHFSDCHEMPGGALAKSLEKLIDRALVRYADHVVAISQPMADYYATLRGGKVSVILNGYDPEVLAAARQSANLSANRKHVVVRYMGAVSPGRIPYNFLNALGRLKCNLPENFGKISVEFFGNAALIENVLDREFRDIKSIFAFYSPVSYHLSLQRIIEADYLLFSETSSTDTVSAQGILTTKLLEYIGSGRPILADISSKTLAGSLIVQCGGPHVVGDTVDRFYTAMIDPGFYQRQGDWFSDVSQGLSRKYHAEQYLEVVHKILEKSQKGESCEKS
jgi:glycosyltransferase involved in cell wall biosynthesis